MSSIEILNQSFEKVVPSYYTVKNYIKSPKGAEQVATILSLFILASFFCSLNEVRLADTIVAGVALCVIHGFYQVVSGRQTLQDIKSLRDGPDEIKNYFCAMRIKNLQDIQDILLRKKEVIEEWKQFREKMEENMQCAFNYIKSSKNTVHQITEDALFSIKKKREKIEQKIQELEQNLNSLLDANNKFSKD